MSDMNIDEKYLELCNSRLHIEDNNKSVKLKIDISNTPISSREMWIDTLGEDDVCGKDNSFELSDMIASLLGT